MVEKPELKPEHLDKLEVVSEEDLKTITGGKGAMPAEKLAGYTLLKIADSSLLPTITPPTTKTNT